MAQTTRTLNCIGSALLDKKNPSMNFHGEPSYEIIGRPASSPTIGGDDLTTLCLKFDAFPATYRRKKLYSATLTDYYTTENTASTGFYTVSVYVESCDDFDENSVTWGSMPQWRGRLGSTTLANSSPSGPITPSSPCAFPASSKSSNDWVAKMITQACCVMIEGDTYSWIGNRLFLNTRHASSKPTLVVSYDSTVDVQYRAVGLNYTSGRINRYIDNTFRWTIEKAEEAYCMSEPVQISAEFRWSPDMSTWYSIPISGAENKLTVPAGTFSGATIYWRIKITDDLETERSSEIYTLDASVGDLVASPASPIGGAYLDPLSASPMMWTNTNALGILTQTAADLQYSTNGTSWTALGSVIGESQTYNVPANTFASGTYYWRVRAYNADGTAGPWSDAAEFTTVDATMYAAPVSPAGEICEYTSPIDFVWRNYSDTGTTPTMSSLQWSADGATWTQLAFAGANELTYRAPANTFHAGTVFWRVKCYNHSSAGGPWSDTASFISYGAPQAPSVTVDTVPYATIRWQSAGQEAWRLTVDGKMYGPYFGTEKSYTLEEPLADGQHTAKVEIEGAFGLWSEPGEAVFYTENQPTAAIYLQGSFRSDAVLRWQSPDSLETVYVYRDGKKIAKTSGMTYTDRFAVGQHSWHVHAKLAGGYYTTSNTVTGKLCPPGPQIARYPDGAWLGIRLSLNQSRTLGTAYSRTASLRHVRGAVYPVLEVAAFRDEMLSFDAAFLSETEARAFEALLGEVIVLKTCDGVIVGYLSQVQRTRSQFSIGFSFSIQRIHWEDYTDET